MMGLNQNLSKQRGLLWRWVAPCNSFISKWQAVTSSQTKQSGFILLQYATITRGQEGTSLQRSHVVFVDTCPVILLQETMLYEYRWFYLNADSVRTHPLVHTPSVLTVFLLLFPISTELSETPDILMQSLFRWCLNFLSHTRLYFQ